MTIPAVGMGTRGGGGGGGTPSLPLSSYQFNNGGVFGGGELVRITSTLTQLGGASVAAPAALTFRVGDSARAGTDADTAGANGILQSGVGTGAGAPSRLDFQVPLVGASGSVAQTMGTVFSVQNSSTTNGTVAITAVAPHGQVLTIQPRLSTGIGAGENGFLSGNNAHFKQSDGGAYNNVYVGLLGFATSGAQDIALTRNAAGVVEVNNGTAVGSGGALRDVVARAITLTCGTITDPFTTLSITGTFNDAADTFRGVEIDFTVTAAGALSTIFRVLKGGTSVFAVGTSGSVTHAAGTLPTGAGTAFQTSATFNDGTATYKGLRVNLTNTASAAASRSFEIAVGGTSVMSVDMAGNIYEGASQVITVRQTGWGAPTNTLTRTTFDTATVTLQQLAERVGALITDLTTHGLIGA